MQISTYLIICPHVFLQIFPTTLVITHSSCIFNVQPRISGTIDQNTPKKTVFLLGANSILIF